MGSVWGGADQANRPKAKNDGVVREPKSAVSSTGQRPLDPLDGAVCVAKPITDHHSIKLSRSGHLRRQPAGGGVRSHALMTFCDTQCGHQCDRRAKATEWSAGAGRRAQTWCHGCHVLVVPWSQLTRTSGHRIAAEALEAHPGADRAAVTLDAQAIRVQTTSIVPAYDL